MAQQITLEERDRIADLTSRGFSQAEIARRLLRSQSTISRELKRNGTASERYAAGAAQQLAEHRRTDRPLVRKMDRPEICSVVQKGLHDDWSPDQISGHLKAQFPDLKSRHISADTIYDWIEKDEHRQMWKGHLRRRGKRPCRRKDRAKDDAARIRNRPEVIELRGRLGDFEGDTVLGPSGTGGIVTLVCRQSRLTRIIRIESKHANHVYGRTRKCLLSSSCDAECKNDKNPGIRIRVRHSPTVKCRNDVRLHRNFRPASRSDSYSTLFFPTRTNYRKTAILLASCSADAASEIAQVRRRR